MPRLLILAPIVVVGIVLTACSGDDEDGADGVVDTSPTPTISVTVQNQPTPVQALAATPAQPEEGVFEVIAEGTSFLGNNVHVVAGQSRAIRVVNRDQVTHNLRVAGLDGQYDTEDDAVTDPPAIEPGSSGELDFAPSVPGAYTFRCDYHPGSMGGQIFVE